GATFSWERFSTSPASASAPSTNTGKLFRPMTTLSAHSKKPASICRRLSSGRRTKNKLEPDSSEGAASAEPTQLLFAPDSRLLTLFAAGKQPRRPKGYDLTRRGLPPFDDLVSGAGQLLFPPERFRFKPHSLQF